MTASVKTTPGKQIGEIVFEYEDGTTVVEPLIHERNIYAFTDQGVGKNLRMAWRGKSNNGKPICAYDILWENPTPEKNIKSVKVKSAKVDSAPVLFAVTAVK